MELGRHSPGGRSGAGGPCRDEIPVTTWVLLAQGPYLRNWPSFSSLDVPSSFSFPVQGPENPRTPEVEQKDTTQAFLSVAPEEGPWGSQALGAGVASPAPCEGGRQSGPLNTVTATCNFFFALPLPSEKEAEFHPDDALGEPWRL